MCLINGAQDVTTLLLLVLPDGHAHGPVRAVTSSGARSAWRRQAGLPSETAFELSEAGLFSEVRGVIRDACSHQTCQGLGRSSFTRAALNWAALPKEFLLGL